MRPVCRSPAPSCSTVCSFTDREAANLTAHEVDSGTPPPIHGCEGRRRSERVLRTFSAASVSLFVFLLSCGALSSAVGSSFQASVLASMSRLRLRSQRRADSHTSRPDRPYMGDTIGLPSPIFPFPYASSETDATVARNSFSSGTGMSSSVGKRSQLSAAGISNQPGASLPGGTYAFGRAIAEGKASVSDVCSRNCESKSVSRAQESARDPLAPVHPPTIGLGPGAPQRTNRPVPLEIKRPPLVRAVAEPSGISVPASSRPAPLPRPGKPDSEERRPAGRHGTAVHSRLVGGAAGDRSRTASPSAARRQTFSASTVLRSPRNSAASPSITDNEASNTEALHVQLRLGRLQQKTTASVAAENTSSPPGRSTPEFRGDLPPSRSRSHLSVVTLPEAQLGASPSGHPPRFISAESRQITGDPAAQTSEEPIHVPEVLSTDESAAFPPKSHGVSGFRNAAALQPGGRNSGSASAVSLTVKAGHAPTRELAGSSAKRKRVRRKSRLPKAADGALLHSAASTPAVVPAPSGSTANGGPPKSESDLPLEAPRRDNLGEDNEEEDGGSPTLPHSQGIVAVTHAQKNKRMRVGYHVVTGHRGSAVPPAGVEPDTPAGTPQITEKSVRTPHGAPFRVLASKHPGEDSVQQGDESASPDRGDSARDSQHEEDDSSHASSSLQQGDESASPDPGDSARDSQHEEQDSRHATSAPLHLLASAHWADISAGVTIDALEQLVTQEAEAAASAVKQRRAARLLETRLRRHSARSTAVGVLPSIEEHPPQAIESAAPGPGGDSGVATGAAKLRRPDELMIGVRIQRTPGGTQVSVIAYTPSEGESSGQESPEGSLRRGDFDDDAHGGAQQEDNVSSTEAAPGRRSPDSSGDSQGEPKDSEHARLEQAEHASPEQAEDASPQQAEHASPEQAECASPEQADPASAEQADPASPEQADPASLERADAASPEQADRASPEQADRASLEQAEHGSSKKAASLLLRRRSRLSTSSAESRDSRHYSRRAGRPLAIVAPEILTSGTAEPGSENAGSKKACLDVGPYLRAMYNEAYRIMREHNPAQLEQQEVAFRLSHARRQRRKAHSIPPAFIRPTHDRLRRSSSASAVHGGAAGEPSSTGQGTATASGPQGRTRGEGIQRWKSLPDPLRGSPSAGPRLARRSCHSTASAFSLRVKSEGAAQRSPESTLSKEFRFAVADPGTPGEDTEEGLDTDTPENSSASGSPLNGDGRRWSFASSESTHSEPRVSVWGPRPSQMLFSVQSLKNDMNYNTSPEGRRKQIDQLIQRMMRVEKWLSCLPADVVLCGEEEGTQAPAQGEGVSTDEPATPETREPASPEANAPASGEQS